jgi:hypothetical protein
MSQDRVQSEPQTEQELADLRQTRFGHLPDRVRPEDLVETKEADAAPEEPVQPMVRREWG